jgi:hypothetical protein
MTKQLQPSPELVAIDLQHIKIDSMSMDELIDHAVLIENTVLGLMQSRHQIGLHRSDALANIRRLDKKLRALIAKVHELIATRQIEAELAKQEHEKQRNGEASELALGSRHQSP